MVKRKLKTETPSSVRKSKLGVTLTPTGLDLLSQIARETGLSKSELVEEIVRGEISIASPSAAHVITLDISPEVSREIVGERGDRAHLKVEMADSEPQPSRGESLPAPVPLEELAAKDRLIAELQNQLTEQDRKLAEQARNCQWLEQECTVKDRQISRLSHQLAQQQTELTQQEQVRRTQERRLATLQQQLAEMNSLAAIGNTQIDRWRKHYFTQ